MCDSKLMSAWASVWMLRHCTAREQNRICSGCSGIGLEARTLKQNTILEVPVDVQALGWMLKHCTAKEQN